MGVFWIEDFPWDFLVPEEKLEDLSWFLVPKMQLSIDTYGDTVDGRNPKQPPGMYLKPCE